MELNEVNEIVGQVKEGEYLAATILMSNLLNDTLNRLELVELSLTRANRELIDIRSRVSVLCDRLEAMLHKGSDPNLEEIGDCNPRCRSCRLEESYCDCAKFVRR